MYSRIYVNQLKYISLLGLNAVYDALNPNLNIRRLIKEGIFTPLDLALLFTGRQEPTTTPLPGYNNYISYDEPPWAKAMRFQNSATAKKKKPASEHGTIEGHLQQLKRQLAHNGHTQPQPKPAPEPMTVQQPTTTTTVATTTTQKPETTTKSLCQLLSESKFRIFLGQNGGMVYGAFE